MPVQLAVGHCPSAISQHGGKGVALVFGLLTNNGLVCSGLLAKPSRITLTRRFFCLGDKTKQKIQEWRFFPPKNCILP